MVLALVKVGGAFTTWLRAELGPLVLKLPLPPYEAVMELMPDGRLVVAKLATPAPFRAPVPRVDAPLKKVTVPEGIPAPGDTAATVAVKVTDWPRTAGFRLELRLAVVVLALLTVCVNIGLMVVL